MFTALHRPISWSLIASLAILAGAGEALHCLPGCGHACRIGELVLLLGVRAPRDLRASNGLPHADRQQLDRPHDREVPIRCEDDCTICSNLKQDRESGKGPPLVLVLPLLHDLPNIVFCDTPQTAPLLSQARAPPIA
jgi:hypothetical protein